MKKDLHQFLLAEVVFMSVRGRCLTFPLGSLFLWEGRNQPKAPALSGPSVSGVPRSPKGRNQTRLESNPPGIKSAWNQIRPESNPLSAAPPPATRRRRCAAAAGPRRCAGPGAVEERPWALTRAAGACGRAGVPHRESNTQTGSAASVFYNSYQWKDTSDKKGAPKGKS